MRRRWYVMESIHPIPCHSIHFLQNQTTPSHSIPSIQTSIKTATNSSTTNLQRQHDERLIPSALLLLSLLFVFGDQGQFQANAEANSEELVDPPKMEDKIGAVPHGLSTDSDVAKREAERSLRSTRSAAWDAICVSLRTPRFFDFVSSDTTNAPILLALFKPATPPKAPKYPPAGFDLTIGDH